MNARKIAVILLSALSLLYLGCGGTPPPEGMRTVKVFDLRAALGTAKIKAPKPEFVKATQMMIDKQRRDAIFMHPNSSAEFPPVHVTKGSWLQVGIGINEQAWTKGTDGVVFSILVRRADGQQPRIFSRYLNPANVIEDRRWVDVELPLGQFAGTDVGIVLLTAAGPNNDRTSDWAGWSSPRMFIELEP